MDGEFTSGVCMTMILAVEEDAMASVAA